MTRDLVEWVNAANDWCRARPIQGPGCGRVATVGRSHAMKFAVSACGSETHVMRLASSACGLFAVVPGVVHTCPGVMGRVHRSVDGSLYPCRMSLSLK